MTSSSSPLNWRGLLSSWMSVLRITRASAGVNGVEIVQAGTGNRPRMQPFSNAGETDIDLDIGGLGTGVARLNGSVPIPPTTVSTKGDLIAGTGGGAYAARSVGTDGYVLTADSAEATGMKWAAAHGGYQDFAHPGTSEYESWFAANCATHTAFSAQALVANRLYAMPFVAAGRAGCTLDRLGINVTTGSTGNARLGIYNDSGGYPGSLLVDAGTVVTTNIAVVTATISQALVPGNRYWLVYVSDATPTIRSIPVNSCSHALGFSNALGTAGNCGLYVSFTYGTLPGTFPSSPTMITGNPIPALFYRYSA